MPTSIAIPQIKLGKRKERSQMHLIETIDGRLIERELPVSDKCAIFDETKNAFLIDHDNQIKHRGVQYQIVEERNGVPLGVLVNTPDHEKGILATRENLFEEAFEQKQTEGIEEINTNDKWGKIVTVVSIICATILIIVAIRWFKGGF